jgi:biopolymer transport protein ExbB
MTKSLFFTIFLGAFFLLGASRAHAQKVDDLSLPGDAAPVIVKTPGAGQEGVEQKKETMLDMIKAGGWAMIPLFAMFFAMIALSVYFFLDLKKSAFSPKALVESMQANAEAGNIQGITESARVSSSCLGQVMHGACEFIYDRGYGVLNEDSIFDQMADASQELNRKRVSLLNYLSVIAQAGPMVGLLGTVSGMIGAFATLNQAGMGNPGQLAGNISEALITTAAGLLVVLPAIFLFFFFRDKIVDLVADVDKNAAKILHSLRRSVIANHQQSQTPRQNPPLS